MVFTHQKTQQTNENNAMHRTKNANNIQWQQWPVIGSLMLNGQMFPLNASVLTSLLTRITSPSILRSSKLDIKFLCKTAIFSLPFYSIIFSWSVSSPPNDHQPLHYYFLHHCHNFLRCYHHHRHSFIAIVFSFIITVSLFIIIFFIGHHILH